MKIRVEIPRFIVCVILCWAATNLKAEAQPDLTSRQMRSTQATDLMGRPAGVFDMRRTSSDLRLVTRPSVHSVSATTANLIWTTSLPAHCEVAWGETKACENQDDIGANYFGSFSLTGLKPETTYYFQIRSLKMPKEMTKYFNLKATRGTSEVISFTTSAENASPQTYYVATHGDDADTGGDLKHAWRTIAHAAAQVNAGDTVQIAGGQYDESIRVLATGSADAPITFQAVSGQKVIVAGAQNQLSQGFIAIGKHHLRFDSLYFQDFNAFPLQGWRLQMSGEFTLHQCKDIQITRCFSDGRGGYSARFVLAWDVDDLLIRNCVIINKMFGSMMLWSAPNLRFEHSVIARPMIQSFVLRNDHHQPATFSNSIFTDMLAKKAKLNISLFMVDFRMVHPKFINNCYYLHEFGPQQRILMGDLTGPKAQDIFIQPLYANPLFAGDPSDPKTYGFGTMLDRNTKPELDFDDFFTTNSQLIERHIGLQPEEFKDFHFTKSDHK